MSDKTPETTPEMIIEAAIMIAGRPLTIAALQQLFPEGDQPSTADVRAHLTTLRERYRDTGIELQEVASGYRFQAKSELSPWLAKLWEERAPRYSRAFLETLAIIAYKQPITRAEIEEIRGVTVSSNIVKTLQEREWIRIIGHREVPGRPAIYGTTKEFLDHFNIKSLSDLPTLAEFKDFEAQDAKLQVQLALENSKVGPGDSDLIPEERDAVITEDNKQDEVITEDNNIVEINSDAQQEAANNNVVEITAEEQEQAAEDELAIA